MNDTTPATTPTTNRLTKGAHHIGLTVPGVSTAAAFFIDALGFAQVGEVSDYPAIFVSDGHIMITLWQARDPSTATAFDRHQNIGLHHFAIAVSDLDAVFAQMSERDDVSIEFAPEPLGSSGLRHLMCRIPGNIRLELIQP